MTVSITARMGLKAGGLTDADINTKAKVFEDLKKLDMKMKGFRTDKLKMRLSHGK